MKPTRPFHEVVRMRFGSIFEKFTENTVSCEEAAALLGISVSSFYRKRMRFESQGAEGLVDQRVGKISAKLTPVDEAMKIINLFETSHFDFTVKHFHEYLPAHGIHRSYSLVKKILQEAGVVKKAPKRGVHRRKRLRKALPGMMLHQDASQHEWVTGQMWDLIVTMDDATSEIYSAFFVAEEGTNSSFRGILDVLKSHGRFCSLYTDRGSHYFFTSEAGGKVDKTRLTQVGRAMKQLGVEMIPAYSPEARGRSERMFGTLQNRLPQELRLHGIRDMESANIFLREVFLPKHNAQFSTPASGEGSAFIECLGIEYEDILCVQEERTVGNDNTVRYNNQIIQILSDKHRFHYVKVKVRVHEDQDGSLAVFHGPLRLSTQLCVAGTAEEKRQRAPSGSPKQSPLAASRPWGAYPAAAGSQGSATPLRAL